MKFTELRDLVHSQFDKMCEENDILFEVNSDKDKLWELYLESFPKEKNKIFRQRREHDCSCCRHFIKSIGNVVAIKGGNVISVWDIDIEDDTYTPSIKSMREYIHSCKIKEAFFARERVIGAKYNNELTDGGDVFKWDHFYANVPDTFVITNGFSKETNQAAIRDTRNVFKRSLDEITEDSVGIILELISQGSLYRGEEYKEVLKKFLEYKIRYENITDPELKELFAWEFVKEAGSAIGRIRNLAIGTLLVDVSNNEDLDTSVRKYESIMAPTNYKRPKPIYTKKMLEDAKKTLSNMGYLDSLKRRYATINDITVNNILFINRDSTKDVISGDIFEEMASSVTVNPKKFSRVEEVNIETFIQNVLPTANEIEVLFENRLSSNLMSLIAPENKDSKTMFKWNNNYCWAYSGNIADSMKERVKAAGGDVTGDLRFSIQWNESGKDNVDLDAHCITPIEREIYFGSKTDVVSGGVLDVDIQRPNNDSRCTDGIAVENITFPDRNRMPDGVYKMCVHQYHGTLTDGFRAEIAFDDNTYSFDYPDTVRQNEYIWVAHVTLKEGQFTIESLLPETNRVSSREVWGLNTSQFVPVSMIMYSPNYWDKQDGIGNKHYFFMLKNCVNPENPNGFYNEFLNNELDKHKRVMEALGSKLAVVSADSQLSGIGFSSTKRNHIIVKVKGKTERTIKVTF